MAKDNDVTVDQVRAVAEQYARDNQISIFDVTVRIVRDLLKRGSDGYIGAHLQTVKLEAAHAQLFCEKQISQQLMAAIYDELKRYTGNSRKVALSEAAVTQQMFDEICERNTELEAALASEKQQLTEQQHANNEKAHRLESELNTAQMEKNALEARHTDVLESKEKTEQILGDTQIELRALKSQASQFKAQCAEKDAVMKELQEELKRLKREHETAHNSNQKAEQHAELLTWKNNQFMDENKKLEKKLELAIERSANAEAQLKVVKKTKTKTTAK
ncbi:hypothetical protein P9J64_16690 [Deltaproteobacteria bacterium IMCC39524]|nr:hypothetical protein [Deltaproteobacteria bacterium IMCC39524]